MAIEENWILDGRVPKEPINYKPRGWRNIEGPSQGLKKYPIKLDFGVKFDIFK